MRAPDCTAQPEKLADGITQAVYENYFPAPDALKYKAFHRATDVNHWKAYPSFKK